MAVDNTTTEVISTQSGTGWALNVTDVNLSEDLTIKDFLVTIAGVDASNDDFTKDTRTQITYTGTAIASSSIRVIRNTPVTRIKEMEYTERLTSPIYEGELNLIHRRLIEIAGEGNNTDPGAGVMTDGRVKVSTDDTTLNYLFEKIAITTGLTKTLTSPGGNEIVTLGVNFPVTGDVDVITINSINAELAGVAKPDNGEVILLFANGYYAVDDGGGGYFYWDESDVSTAVDNGVVFQVNGNDSNGRWKRYRDDTHYWNVAWYGIVGDNSTNNYSRLALLQSTIITSYNNQINIIYFPPSSNSYNYSRNTWTMNIRNLVLVGYGAALKNTSTSTNLIDRQYPLRFNSAIAENSINEAQTSLANKATYQFNSVDEGSYTITVTNTGDAANFSVNEEVMLSGRRRQIGGSVPNVTFFEFLIISSIAGDNITFSSPTLHRYDQLWEEENFTSANADYGKPSITKLDDNDTFSTRNLGIVGITFKLNPTESVMNLVPSATSNCEIKDIIIEGNILPECCKYVFTSKCFILGQFSPSRICEYVEIKDSEIGLQNLVSNPTIGDCAGVRQINVIHNKIFGTVLVNPIEFGVFKENYILGTAFSNTKILGHGDAVATGLLKFENNLLDAQAIASDQDNPSIHPYGTLRSLTVVGTSSGNITMPDDSSNFELTHTLLLEGHYLIKNDGSNGGTITKIRHDGANYVLEGTWATPAVNDVFHWLPVQAVNLQGNFLKSQTRGSAEEATGLLRAIPDYPFYMGQNEQFRVTVLTSEMMGFESSLNTFNDVLGYIMEIEVFITKAYSGTDPNPLNLRIRPLNAANGSLGDIEIDMKVAGHYRFNVDGVTGIRPGFTAPYDLGGFGSYVTKIQLDFLLAGSEYVETDNSRLPKGMIKMHLFNPRANRPDTANTAN